MVDNHQPIGRQLSTVRLIIMNHTADNYRPLKFTVYLIEKTGMSIDNKRDLLVSER